MAESPVLTSCFANYENLKPTLNSTLQSHELPYFCAQTAYIGICGHALTLLTVQAVCSSLIDRAGMSPHLLPDTAYQIRWSTWKSKNIKF